MPCRASRPDRAAQARRGAAAAAVLAAAAVAGCGSAGPGALPPAATPAASPPEATAPAGRVLRVGPPGGPAPSGLAVDPDTGRVAVGLADPAQLVLLDGASGAVRGRVGLPSAPGRLAAAHGDVFVPATRARSLLRVRARDARVLGARRLGFRPTAALAGEPGDAFAAGSAAGGAGAVAAVGAGGARAASVDAAPTSLARADAGRVAVVAARERTLELVDATTLQPRGTASAGVGPTQAVARGPYVWVVDTQGEALLVFRVTPKLELVRRLYLAGGPYAIALDTTHHRLWVTFTQTNEVAELPAHGRPHELQRLPTVRQPDAIAVDSLTHRLFVGGAGGRVELIDPPPTG